MASPRLTVKSVAAYLRGTTSRQKKILRDHKYPKQEPQVHQPPYYQIAIGGVRQYYRAENDPAALVAAQNRAQNIGQKAKREHNIRILEKFRDSPLASRSFSLQKNSTFSAALRGVNIRLSPDMQAVEKGMFKVIYFHCREEPIDEATAILMAEVAHWVMQQNRIELQSRQIEVIDLSKGKSYSAKKWSDSLPTALAEHAGEIVARWEEA